MPADDHRAATSGSRPASGSTRIDAGGSPEPLRGNDSGGGAIKALSGERGRERPGPTELRKQTITGFPLGAANERSDGTGRRLGSLAIQPPAIVRPPPSLISRPLFLHPVPPFRASSLPLPVPAPLLFPPPRPKASQPPVPTDSAQTQGVPQTQSPAQVLSPKVELNVTSSAIDTAPASVETPSSSNTVLTAASTAPSPESAIASTTPDSAPDIVPIAFATGEPVAASLVDSSFANPDGTSDILPVANSGVGVGGKVAAACVIGAVFLLLLNWAFWLVIRRRRRARRSLPAHWDFGAPPRVKDGGGRDAEDTFAHPEDEGVAERDVKGGMVTIAV